LSSKAEVVHYCVLASQQRIDPVTFTIPRRCEGKKRIIENKKDNRETVERKSASFIQYRNTHALKKMPNRRGDRQLSAHPGYIQSVNLAREERG
jgi:hypothetical protein